MISMPGLLADAPEIETSDPLFEFEHLRFASAYSNALQRRGEICLFIPPLTPESADIPLVLLLHGFNGNAWSWALQGGVSKTATALVKSHEIRPMVVAMPGDGSLLANSGYLPYLGRDHEHWVVDEVLDITRKLVKQVSNTSPVFLAGLSMGGFGALRLAAKYPDRYLGAAAHSPITKIQQLEPSYGPPNSGGPEGDGESSILFWAERNARTIPPLQLTCGKDDPLIGECFQLHQSLKHLGVVHTYDEPNGDHSWQYWRKCLPGTLRFFEDLLS